MKLSELLSRLICPPKCICCKEIFSIYDTSVLCPSCYEKLKLQVKDVANQNTSAHFDLAYSYYNYHNWYVKKLIAHTKYVFCKEYKEFIGKCAAESLRKHNLVNKIDLITFSPRRVTEISKYGFDQAEELAKAISKKIFVPCEQLLKRTGKARPQKELSNEKRLENTKGKFQCSAKLDGKRILIVDDVMTTGFTMNECAKMLKKQGAKAVYVWTIAQ